MDKGGFILNKTNSKSKKIHTMNPVVRWYECDECVARMLNLCLFLFSIGFISWLIYTWFDAVHGLRTTALFSWRSGAVGKLPSLKTPPLAFLVTPQYLRCLEERFSVFLHPSIAKFGTRYHSTLTNWSKTQRSSFLKMCTQFSWISFLGKRWNNLIIRDNLKLKKGKTI